MSTYSLTCINDTESTWTFGLFQKLPNFEGLVSLAWKRSAVPPKGQAILQWDVVFNVSITDYKQTNGVGVYTSEQVLDTNLGQVWECQFVDGCQQLVPAADQSGVTGDELLIRNRSGRLGNLGVGMSGSSAVLQPDVEDNASAQFVVKPKYYLGLFNRLKKGEVIKSNVAVGPINLVYGSGRTEMTATAAMAGATISLTHD
ncbi:hypothetical protein EV659_101179 [Rhodothalassium salexigens DSM 2132]|uniref:Uncharacterized protein n=1 Tax=Rhodothalassium salexigens DSM 2132 TaxID=1188247 RepID=A0A4R2PVV5_RHOSA|nr:hypothetical protein [Rhodothalassium salexigens]MBB4210116.1 hypothetical protein [Rhodothalassium salexigens DSM 2132]MBK1638440.1 hypothetical protein [Rhodothalassium salexigens DSM 2132]TCP38281.1 hypothetical protein EV659_101179 [Rhodothalassium salexigens DSM 2132]